MIFVRVFVLLLAGTTMIGCSLIGKGSEEQPDYEVVLLEDDFEVRRYRPYLSAQTTVTGEYKKAQNEGFKILAGYIFGKNESKKKIEMTSPVVQKKQSEKISMTAPVIIAPQKNADSTSAWTMTFSMPSKYTRENLPDPVDQRISIVEVPNQLLAVNRFTGFWGENKNTVKARQLQEWLARENQYQVTSEPMFAGYNPPWTIPFFRRNEVLVEVEAVAR